RGRGRGAGGAPGRAVGAPPFGGGGGRLGGGGGGGGGAGGVAPPPRAGTPRAALPFRPVNARLSTRSRHPRMRLFPLGSNQRGNLGGSPWGTGGRWKGHRP